MLQRATLLIGAYGSLRPTEFTYLQIQSIVQKVTPSRIIGDLYSYGKGGLGGYPVANLDGAGVINTNTLLVPLCHSITRLIDMEINAGYEPVWVDELDRQTSIPTGRKVLSFDYSNIADPDIGPLIESGDWIEWVRTGREKWVKDHASQLVVANDGVQ